MRLPQRLGHGIHPLPLALPVDVPGAFQLTKSAERPRRSRRGWIGVGRAGLNAQEPNNTHAVPEPSMGEGTAWLEAPAFMPGRTSTQCFADGHAESVRRAGVSL